MSRPEDDDPVDDWLTAPKTTVDQPPTAPYRSLDWLAGRREGFPIGVEQAIRAFLTEAARRGLPALTAVGVARRIRAAAIADRSA